MSGCVAAKEVSFAAVLCGNEGKKGGLQKRPTALRSTIRPGVEFCPYGCSLENAETLATGPGELYFRAQLRCWANTNRSVEVVYVCALDAVEVGRRWLRGNLRASWLFPARIEISRCV